MDTERSMAFSLHGGAVAAGGPVGGRAAGPPAAPVMWSSEGPVALPAEPAAFDHGVTQNPYERCAIPPRQPQALGRRPKHGLAGSVGPSQGNGGNGGSCLAQFPTSFPLAFRLAPLLPNLFSFAFCCC